MEVYDVDGSYFVDTGSHFLSGQHRLGHDLWPPGGRKIMTWLYVITAVLALALLVYLFIALIKPEWF
jgi:K+-transporting ATPase KdpF subunit